MAVSFVAPGHQVMEQINLQFADDALARGAAAAAFAAVYDNRSGELFAVIVDQTTRSIVVSVGGDATEVTVPQSDRSLLVDVPVGVSVDGPGARGIGNWDEVA